MPKIILFSIISIFIFNINCTSKPLSDSLFYRFNLSINTTELLFRDIKLSGEYFSNRNEGFRLELGYKPKVIDHFNNRTIMINDVNPIGLRRTSYWNCVSVSYMRRINNNSKWFLHPEIYYNYQSTDTITVSEEVDNAATSGHFDKYLQEYVKNVYGIKLLFCNKIFANDPENNAYSIITEFFGGVGLRFYNRKITEFAITPDKSSKTIVYKTRL